MKKVWSIVLILMMVLGSLTTVFGTEGELPVTLKPGILISPKPVEGLTDVSGTVYEEAVKALVAAQVVAGYEDKTFRPANTLTRAEACTFLVNYLAPTEEERNAAPDSGFSDVSGWATTFINYAVEKGIVKGYPNGTFRPDQKVNYQELATMTVNALGIDPQTLVGGYPDAFINKAKELGMYENISVTKKNTQNADRGDTALMIYSLVKYKDTSAKDAAIERLMKSDAALTEVKSLSYETLMDLAISAGEDSVVMKNTMKLDMITEPLMMYMLADVVSDDEMETAEYYYVTEGDELVMYMLMDGQWYKMSMGDELTAAIPENPMEEMDMYLNAYDNLRIEGKDVIGGKTVTKFYCELGSDYIDEVMSEMDMVGQMVGDSNDENQALVTETIQMMKGFGYYIWIDDETDQLVKVRMDMKDLMQSLLGTMIDGAIESAVAAETDLSAAEKAELKAALEKEMSSTRIDQLTMEMVLTNINTIEEIKLPTELKNAIDLGASVGAEPIM